jgi:hypothetical protein
MPAIDVADEVFLTVPQRVLADSLADPALCRRYWPDLTLVVHADRGEQGMCWTVGGALTGSMEVWLEPVLEGTVLHYFLRAELAQRPASRRQAAAETRRRRLAAREMAFALKDRFERDRAPGCPPALVSEQTN